MCGRLVSQMYNAKSWLHFLLSCFSFIYIGMACGQNALRVSDNDLLGKREALQERLLELQLTIGQYDPALVETLTSLAESSSSLHLYTEASALLDRSLQIQRVSSGLLAQEQIPLVVAKMDIAVLMGDWETVNASISYLEWLLIEKNVTEGDVLIQYLVKLSEFHLKGVNEDILDRQAFHYQQASKYTYQALSIGQFFWGSKDFRLIDLYYGLLKQFYLQSAAVERADETAYALRAIVPGSSWVKPRRIVQSRFYQAGLRLLSDIRDIIRLTKPSSPESLAMVDLYIADWHVIFDKTQALVAYKNAFVKLGDAGVSSKELDLLFSEPKILPVPTFYAEVSNALAASYFSESELKSWDSKGVNLQLDFQEWSESMSKIAQPDKIRSAKSLKQNRSKSMQLHFCLSGLNKVSHWVRGRYRTNLSVANGFHAFGSENEMTFDTKFIDDNFSLLHFRPRLKEGIAQNSEGLLLFQGLSN